MAEYIKRDEAMAMRFSDGINEDGVIYVPYRDVAAHLKSLPDADVRENVHGEWGDDGFLNRKTCSICGTWIADNTGTAKLNFCPNCGADNRGEQNGKNR